MKSINGCSVVVTREKAEAASEFMKRLANPNRLIIACALVDGERSVGELEAALGLKQPSLSQRLAELREAGIVEARREVKQVFYRLSDPRAVALIATLHRLFFGEELDQPKGETYAAAAAGPQRASSQRVVRPAPARGQERSPEAAGFARVLSSDALA